MGYTDRRLGFVNMLPAGATRAKGVDLKVGWINVDFHILRLGKHRYRHGRGVYSSLSFRLWNPLNPMYPAFVFQSGISSLTLNHKADFFKAP